jgi:hypothetical protein
MKHCSTTLDHIVTLSDQYLTLLNSREPGEFLTDEEQWQCVEIRRALDSLWPKRRQELTFRASGPPRMLSAPDPRSVRQVARFAHGIAPLPQGGD